MADAAQHCFFLGYLFKSESQIFPIYFAPETLSVDEINVNLSPFSEVKLNKYQSYVVKSTQIKNEQPKKKQ